VDYRRRLEHRQHAERGRERVNERESAGGERSSKQESAGRFDRGAKKRNIQKRKRVQTERMK
jgi:hypothetical protein